MKTTSRRLLAGALALMPAATTAAQTMQTGSGGGFGEPGDPVPIEAYSLVDNVEGDWVNLMNPPYRPMVLADDGTSLWSVDNHNHQVHYFELAAGSQPVKTFGVPAGPVALARWSDGVADHLVVVCRTSWAACLLDADSGRIVATRQMVDPATGRQLGEPADVVIVGNSAFVSCSASDAVAELSLPSLNVTRVYYLPAKHPTFLSVDAGGNVFVTPQASGNGTLVHRGSLPGTQDAGDLGIIDTEDEDYVLAGSELNDYDLFRLDPGSGTAIPVARRVGTVMFEHAFHPDGTLWMLSTDANTRDRNRQSEPSIQGDIAVNQLSRVALVPGTVVTAAGENLDNASGAFSSALSVAQPFSLLIPSFGWGFVAGLLSDNVTILKPDGTFHAEWNLTEGAIPRGLVYSPQLNSVFVHCWGLNRVEGYDLSSVLFNPDIGPTYVFELGYDPTPLDLREGRRIFFDSKNSRDERFSCATCHVDGGFDGIAWDLGKPEDPKGPMTTQSMSGLETLHPFHWRGEQKGAEVSGFEDQLMVDFNDAFVDLLGAPAKLSVTPGGDWDKFEDFVFSMQVPANPGQDRRRVLSQTINGPLLPGDPDGNPIAGRTHFNQACASCHSLPKGTVNDIKSDGIPHHDPHQLDFKIAPFQEDYRWEQDTDPQTPGIQLEFVAFETWPDLPDGEYPPLGVSTSHAGVRSSLRDFIGEIFTILTPQGVSNITEFIHQWDNGLAPVVHQVFHVAQGSDSSIALAIQNYLVPQCTVPMQTGSGQSVINGDFAVFGTFEWEGVEIPMRWYWDRDDELLVPEDSTVTKQTVAALLQQAAAGKSYNTFVGMPVGTARRFAIDFDGDGIPNIDELNFAGGPLDPESRDTDMDGWWDLYEIEQLTDPLDPGDFPMSDNDPPLFDGPIEVLWTTSRVAVLRFKTKELARAVVDYSTSQGFGDADIATSDFALHHRVVLANLDAGLPYTASVEIFDAMGAASTIDTVTFQTVPLFGPHRVTISDLDVTPDPVLDPNDPITVDVTLADRETPWAPSAPGNSPPPPLDGQRVIARLLLDGLPLGGPAELDTFGRPKEFSIGTVDYSEQPGPFVISDPVVAGQATLEFALPAAVSGQRLTLILIGAERPTGNGSAAKPDFANLSELSPSDTPATLRKLDIDL